MLDSGTNKHPENRIHLFDPVGLINDSYGGYRSSSYAVRPPRRLAKSYESFTDHTNTSGGLRTTYDSSSEKNPNNGGVPRSDDNLTDSNNGGPRSYDHSSSKETGLRFGVATLEDESDISTPRLWKPTKQHNYQQNMSPSSRTQVIAKGRREMMDMVRDLPESYYELSLKDIVDQKPGIEEKKEIDMPEEKKKIIKETTNNNREAKKEKNENKKSSKKVKKSESKKKMVRCKSVDSGGFLIRTSVFPNFLGAKRRKKSLSASSSCKISSRPKPKQAQMKGVEKEKEWWRRKSCISSESDQSNNASSSSSGSSTRSNSINARHRNVRNRFLRGFCFFNGKRIRGKT